MKMEIVGEGEGRSARKRYATKFLLIKLGIIFYKFIVILNIFQICLKLSYFFILLYLSKQVLCL